VTAPSCASWPALGTTASVVVADRAALGGACAVLEAEIAAIDAACSRFRDDSELSRLNASPGRSMRVSPLFLEAVEVALRAAKLTGGLVDPTVGEALVLAGYDRDFAEGLAEPVRRPTLRTIAGWRAVLVDRDRGRVRIPRGVRLDLGATAKALAADRAAAAASRATGGHGVLVSLGGDIAVAGRAPAGGWTVRVAEDHRAGPDAPGQTVTITLGGLATSSTTVRRWGRDSHHVIDPRTSRPARSRWRTASVAAASCVDANIATTAALIYGDDAPEWLESLGVPARLVRQDGRTLTVGRWPAERVAA
jgi:thiamine biosynthesis lipoprotein